MKSKNYKALFPILIVISTLFISIGYASINSVSIGLEGSLLAQVQEGIFISEYQIINDEFDENDDYSNATIKSCNGTVLTSTIELPNDNNNGFITYTITIYNNTDVNYMFEDVKYFSGENSYDNENIVFDELNNLAVGDKLLSHSSVTFDMTFHYKDNVISDNNVLNSILNFSFKEYYTITYENITNNGYPTEVMAGSDLNITFIDEIPEGVFVSGMSSYTYEDGYLTMINATDNVVISNAVVFRYDGEYVFDGTNYIDTGVSLFSEENFNKNFEVSFSIVSYDETQTDKATLFNSLDEVNTDFPGVLFRVTADTENYEVLGNNKINNLEQVNNLFEFSDITKVKILRINNITYFSVNDGDYYELQDYTVFNEYFDIPATFGASLDSNGEPWRYFKGTLKDMKIKYLDQDTTIEAFELAYNSLSTVKFDGTNYLNTGVYLFNEENINKDFDITFTIKAYDATQTVYSTIMNSLDESTSSFPGIIFRFYITASEASSSTEYTPTKYQLIGNGTSKTNVSIDDLTISQVRIIRRENIVYYSIDNSKLAQLQDFSDFTTTFDVPVTFGASLDSSGEPYRYFKGSLSNIEVRIKNSN